MTVYEAIHRMRQLTARRQPFALSYMTCSLTRRTSEGEVSCEHALLIKNADTGDAASLRNHMLTYRDQDTGQTHHCWQPLLLSLNHEPLTSID